MSVLLAGFAGAATFTVDSTVDDVDAAPGDGVCATADGACTLRAAIQETNALVGPDTITVPDGTYVLTIPGTGEDAAATGDLDITDELEIDGAGAATTIVDGNGLDDVFDVRAKTRLTDLTVRNGVGGIFAALPVSYAGLTVTRCIVTGNHGIGITFAEYFGSLEVTDTAIADNAGTGIWATFSFVTLERVLVSGNAGGGMFLGSCNTGIGDSAIVRNVTRGDGGGVDAGCIDGYTGIDNSTISGNRADGKGGGIACLGDYAAMGLVNVTITDNVAAAEGGGVWWRAYSALGLFDTIIAGNRDGTGAESDCTVAGDAPPEMLDAFGVNLIEDIGNCAPSTGCATPGCIPDGVIVGTDPKLGPLGDHGGPTPTHALLAGSPAIDAGGQFQGSDQRGVSRPQFAACDLGAYEFACGNGTLDPGEECDDGNHVDGDGCSPDCIVGPVVPPVCGDGMVRSTEACDLGARNGAPDSCCNADCTLRSSAETCRPAAGPCDVAEQCTGSGAECPPDASAPGGEPCPDDGDVCTADACDGSGACVHTYEPDPECISPASRGASLRIVAHADPTLPDLVRFLWGNGPAVPPGDFGSPTGGTTYGFCVYDGSSSGWSPVYRARPVGDCSVEPCWSPVRTGWRFQSTSGVPDGITSLRLRPNLAPGRARIEVRAKGALSLTDLPLHVAPLVAQVRTSDGKCWGATFSTARRNVAGQLGATSD